MNLNGPAARKEIEAFAAKVLADYEGWVMDWTPCSGGMCERRRQVIYLPERLIHGGAEWEAREYVLHEVCHIESGEPGDGHGRAFYEAYIGLLNRWMLVEGPKCKLRWENGRFTLECDTPEDRDRAAKALETEEVVVRVKNTGGVP